MKDMTAMRIATFQAYRWKAIWMRPRPSQLAPALLPPIEVPGHPSYPSGHSTQSFLLAFCLQDVMPDELWDVSKMPVPNFDPPEVDPPAGPLIRMARRMARNREVLGVHYQSDTNIGETLATKCFALITHAIGVAPSNPIPYPGQPNLYALFEAAKAEWRIA
jgi:hypothetical protein